MSRRVGGGCAAILLLLSAHAPSAAAQQAAPLQPPRVELSGGFGGFSGAGLGSRDADLRANSATPQAYRLFSTSTRLAAAPLIEARAGVTLSRRFGVEARFGYARPELRTSVTADVENAPALTVVERIDQFAIDGGVVVRIDEWRFIGLTPFVTGGVGYLRQVHAGQTLIEQGHSYYAGGGVRRAFVERERHVVKAAGIRADVRLEWMSGGVAFDDRLETHVTASGAFFIGL